MKNKKYWANEYEYRRVLQILDDYWLTEKDEAFVSISMHFRNKNGMTQDKTITWTNPADKTKAIGVQWIPFSSIEADTEADILLHVITRFFEIENPAAKAYSAMLKVMQEFEKKYPEDAAMGTVDYFAKKYNQR